LPRAGETSKLCHFEECDQLIEVHCCGNYTVARAQYSELSFESNPSTGVHLLDRGTGDDP